MLLRALYVKFHAFVDCPPANRASYAPAASTHTHTHFFGSFGGLGTGLFRHEHGGLRHQGGREAILEARMASAGNGGLALRVTGTTSSGDERRQRPLR